MIIVIQNKEDTTNEIYKECREIFSKKIEIMNKKNEIIGKDNRQLEFCVNEGQILLDLNIYIPNVMNRLWESPKIVASIIEKAKIDDIKNHLAPLFVNNFYENIFSSKLIEDNLMYVLSLLLESEIKNLKNIDDKDKFLENTPCGIMLEELINKVEIQKYFDIITKNELENLEKSLSYKINFDPEEIAGHMRQKLIKEEKYITHNKYPYDSDEDLEIGDIRDKRKEQSEQENFNKNYIPNLDKSALIRLIEENKGDKNIYEYLNSKIPNCEKANKIFSNERLFSFFSKYKKPEGLIILYQHQFMIVKEFIEKIFKNILDNIHIIPYPIKYLCRIISEFIRQKFPSISIHDKNAFIGKFIFGKLLIPFLLDPITEYCFNENVYDSLKVICLILKKYISGEFFITDDSEFNYTPFNWLFINNIGIIFNIFKFLSKEELSPFIEMIVNNKLPSDYEYDFFKENPNEIVNISSIFYNTEQIWVLVKTIDENKDLIFINGKNDKLKKSVEKLMLNNHQKLFLEILYTEKDIIPKEQGGVLAFTPTNIVNNQLVLNVKNTYITRAKYDESPEIMVKNGNILFVKTGSTLGKSALVTGFNEDSTVSVRNVELGVNVDGMVEVLSGLQEGEKIVVSGNQSLTEGVKVKELS